ncbi:metallo-beta-lactamase superfamily protein [Candidatus Blochmanniella vafra str. BVAF]|uniref:Metallo-beta-lactamase superfamily protein n=1 Tax=Blochmanniella vafra (strain BVAF) TaxID=859654 RepID=E8Q6B9_BLOVB|nr:MBL fold metallo-hydrolase [Candidatus Blochmannia vafer]ADV33813.1 metallo-beta-lactamase superfamily protein [Candidatus Blochmannia vafer str. BVAF]
MKYHVIPVTSFNQNCSIVWCEQTHDAIVVDPGGEKEKLFRVIDNLNVRINKIVLTHGHIDHVGHAVDLKKYYNVPIWGPHKDDEFLMNDLTLQCQILKIKEYCNCAVSPDFWLKDGDIIEVGYEVFKVLHCPGHSPGHVVFWNESCKFIIMGDVLFKKNVGRSDLPGGSYVTLINSIKNKLLVLEDDINFLPGHGPISSIGYERKNNTFLI